MSGVEDRDLGFAEILAELRKLGELEVRTGIQGTEDSELVKIATIHEFGSRQWQITAKQAYWLALRIVYKRVPEPGGAMSAARKAQVLAIARKLRGKTMKIPERSFLRSTFDARRSEIGTAAERVVGKVASGKTAADVAARQFGQFTETLFRRGLLAVKEPPNAPLTIKLKKSDQPLVDTGRLRASIRSVIVPRTTQTEEQRPE